MKKFTYKAWDKNYNIFKGTIEEEGISSAKDALIAKEFNVIDIQEQKDIKNLSIFKVRLKDLELSNFCGQLAIVLSSGMNLLKGLEVLQTQLSSKKMKPIIDALYTGVKRGLTLGRSMKDTGAFPMLLCDMVESGEMSGNTDSIFYNMEDFYAREGRIKEKIKSASVYPGMLLTVSVGMVFFFNTFIFPDLKDMFADNTNLPFITKALLASMNFLNKDILYVVIGIVSIILLCEYLKTRKKVAYFLDYISINNPILKKIKMEMVTGRFTRSMGLFLKSGVPILVILNSLKSIMGNLYLQDRIEMIKENITNGNNISDAFQEAHIFEPIVVQMVKMGEETGRLEETLDKLADIYDKRSEATMAKLMALIEPVFTLVIGIFIAVLILAMAMPIMQMSTGVK